MKKILIAFVLTKLFSFGFAQVPAGCNFAVENNLYTCTIINGNIDSDKMNDEIIGTHNPNTFTNADVKKVVSTDIVTQYLLFAALNNFENVEIIEFPKGNLGSLDSSFFVKCDKLTSFSATQSTGLTTIQSKTFSACSSLVSIVLPSNFISTIQGDAFEKLTSLTLLDLSDNIIINPAQTAFRGLSALKVVKLNKNDMVNLSDKLFETNTQLEVIDMSENKIVALKKALVAQVKDLKIFDLRKNAINKTEREFFDKFTQLEKFYFLENVCYSGDYETVDLETVKADFETCFKNNDATEISFYSKIVLLFVALAVKFM
jgi:Leucine-rich repeat (LRR) protein